MNQFFLHTKIHFCAFLILFSSLYGAENQTVEAVQKKITDTHNVAWYKKRSVRIAAATALTAVVVLYALAVHKNKVVGPIAFLTTLFGSQKSLDAIEQKSKPENLDKNNIEPSNDPFDKKQQEPVALTENQKPADEPKSKPMNENPQTDSSKQPETPPVKMEKKDEEATPESREMKGTMAQAFDNMIQKVFGNNTQELPLVNISPSQNIATQESFDNEDIPSYR